MLNLPDKDVSYLNKRLDAWKARLETVVTELLSVLEGTCVISSSGRPLMLMFVKNHRSCMRNY